MAMLNGINMSFISQAHLFVELERKLIQILTFCQIPFHTSTSPANEATMESLLIQLGLFLMSSWNSHFSPFFLDVVLIWKIDSGISKQ